MTDQLNHDPLTAAVVRGAAGGARATLTRETGYRALDADERDAEGDRATMTLSTPGSIWKITVERIRTS